MLWPLQVIFNAACTILPCHLTGQQLPFQYFGTTSSHRIAIIGAGAGGSSAAFWIAKGRERAQLDIEIDIYERAGYVGGRSTIVYPYGNSSYPPIELGASIFVDANKNLLRATKEFNLTVYGFDDEKGENGVWDGQGFVVKIGGSNWWNNWWNKLQILWRYGYKAPSRTLQIVKDMITSYVTLYSPNTPRWHNVSEVAFALGFTQYTLETMSEYFDEEGIDQRWTREIVEAATRVNYGQNVDSIQALGGLASLAANGAKSVTGGNFQIFEHFISTSGARLFLNKTVISLERTKSRWIVETANNVSKSYDSVIIAAPWTSTSIRISPELDLSADPVEYLHLHVTLLTTASPYPNTTYFASEHQPPRTILTTFEGVRNGLREPAFNSISYHGSINEGSNREWIVKIFSKSRLSSKWLNKVFNGRVGWVYRKEWDAYPVLKPRRSFPSIQPAEGLYYVNAFEPFMSTMETETVASRNVVGLLFEDRFNTTICGTIKSEKLKPDFVYGWDC